MAVQDATPPWRQRIAAVVPCYNAGGRLRPVLEGLSRQLDHTLLIDDGSTDGSADQADGLPVDTWFNERNLGKGSALILGFTAALALPHIEAVVVLDADGQHDPKELPRFVDAFYATSADLVIGSRVFDMAHVPWRSWFGNTLTVKAVHLLFGRHIRDTQCGYRLLSRRFLEAVVRDVRGGRYDTEMEILLKAVKEDYRIAEVPIATLYEAGNPSSHFRKVRDSARIYWRIVRARLH
ncbi:MAG: glycosyltransferase family 2 protein [Candidatus Hydrogenedentes bacterium]|nr:glycosyltransferase family 2 protein [Candidatus Hydrogenedentota bacterium]